MNCSIQGCPGVYEPKEIIHTVRHNGHIVVLEHVPAEVCSTCGDTILRPETIRHIEELLADRKEPHRLIPAYDYA